MKFLSLSVLVIFLVIGCKSGDSNSGTDSGDGIGGQSLPDHCSAFLKICEGDYVYEFGDFSTGEERRIEEYLKPGELSKSEKKFVAEMGPHFGPGWEQGFKEAALKAGERIILEGSFGPVGNDIYGAALGNLYRKTGCKAGGHCVGYSQLSFGGLVSEQTVIGISLLPTAKEPYLIERYYEVHDSLSVLPVAGLGMEILSEGCVELEHSAIPFCVGDQLFVGRSNTSLKDFEMRDLTFVTSPDNEPGVVLEHASKFPKFLDNSFVGGTTIFSRKGCAPGNSSICLPDLIKVPLYRERYKREPAVWYLEGVLLPDLDDDRKPLLLTDQDGEFDDRDTSWVEAYLFIGKGCQFIENHNGSVDACVGQLYKIHSEDGQWELLGIRKRTEELLVQSKDDPSVYKVIPFWSLQTI